MKDASVRVRVDSHLKEEVVHILDDLGLNMSQVVNAMLTQIKLQQGIPFDIRTPNATTRDAIRAATRRKTRKAKSVKTLLDSID